MKPAATGKRESGECSLLFSADRPRKSLSEDLLDRRRFASAVAQAVAEWKGKDSLVVALHGSWGSGKTTIKNFILEDLRGKVGQGGPLVVEFSPWLFSGRQRIFDAFFAQIGAALSRRDDRKKAKKLAEGWSRFASLLKHVASLPDVATTWVVRVCSTLLAVPTLILAFLGPSIGIWVSAVWMKILLAAIGIAFLVIALLARAANFVAEILSSWYSFRTALATRSADEVKGDLSREMRKLDRPLLVVVDDLDRLDAKEIHVLFQLVKANADFPARCPNTTIAASLDTPENASVWHSTGWCLGRDDHEHIARRYCERWSSGAMNATLYHAGRDSHNEDRNGQYYPA